MTGGSLTAVAIDSVRSWFDFFTGPNGRVLFLGEDATVTETSVDELLTASRAARIRIFSSHDTLRRDLLLADALRQKGAVVLCQSEAATRAATDKVFAKRTLERSGLPTARWGVGVPPVSNRHLLLRKSRHGAQSQGLCWASGAADWGDAYWEEYVDGVEYSVVLYREEERVVAFPPVWKGRTRRDLAPPWRRLRVCPAPAGDSHAIQELIDLACRAAEVLEVWGFAEVEFVWADRGPTILELNPRISGTLRLAAMASSVQVFDPIGIWAAGSQPPAVFVAGELPYQGEPFCTSNAIATKRVTCVGATASEVRELLKAFAADDTFRAADWPLGWSG